EVSEAAAIRRKAGNYLRQIAETRHRGRRASAPEAIDELRRITERLAKRKLAATAQRRRLPPVAWGEYSLQFTPPYAGLGSYAVGQITSVTGNPTISATGIDNLGQLSCSVDTNMTGASAGTASNMLGVYFKPLFTSATARISFSSQFSFSWYVNS